MKITAIIPVLNEEKNIVEAIKSVDFANEIIVVDSYSSDNTVKLAKPFVHKLIQRKYKDSASQKNWAIKQAKHKWIFVLDADERVSPELKEEILHIVKSKTKLSAYWIRRQNYFMGQKINFSGWKNDRVIRLFKRDENEYEKKRVHAEINSQGKVGLLKNILTHNTYQSKEHYEKKIHFYAKLQAKDYHKKITKINFYHKEIKPMIRFLKHFIFNLGFFDGHAGLMISLYQYKAVKLRYKYLNKEREKSRNRKSS